MKVWDYESKDWVICPSILPLRRKYACLWSFFLSELCYVSEGGSCGLMDGCMRRSGREGLAGEEEDASLLPWASGQRRCIYTCLTLEIIHTIVSFEDSFFLQVYLFRTLNYNYHGFEIWRLNLDVRYIYSFFKSRYIYSCLTLEITYT